MILGIDPGPTHRPSCAERFWLRVDRSAGPDACWPWLGSRHGFGYGWFWCEGKNQGAHRVAIELHRGRLLVPGEVVRHAVCDNPPCCNPAHLSVGSTIDNIADKVARRRHSHGESHHAHRLSRDKADEIRRRYAAGGTTLAALAAEHGVTAQAIWCITSGRTWR